MERTSEDRKWNSVYLWRVEIDWKEASGDLWRDGNVLEFGWDSGDTDVHIYEDLSNCVLNNSAFPLCEFPHHLKIYESQNKTK